MSAMQEVGSNKVMNAKVLIRLLLGALIGAIVGFALMRSALALSVSVKSMTWSDFLAAWLGVTFFGVGLAMYGVSFNRRELARNLEGLKAKLPASPEEVRTTRLQSIALVLAGMMLVLPILAMGSIEKTPHLPEIIFACILLLFGVQTWANILLWRGADEFLKIQMLLTCAVTFTVGQALLFLWAAAEHLHLVGPISSWDTITLLMTIYISTGAYLTIGNRPGR